MAMGNASPVASITCSALSPGPWSAMPLWSRAFGGRRAPKKSTSVWMLNAAATPAAHQELGVEFGVFRRYVGVYNACSVLMRPLKDPKEEGQ